MYLQHVLSLRFHEIHQLRILVIISTYTDIRARILSIHRCSLATALIK